MIRIVMAAAASTEWIGRVRSGSEHIPGTHDPHAVSGCGTP
jgi:hypothetical protein